MKTHHPTEETLEAISHWHPLHVKAAKEAISRLRLNVLAFLSTTEPIEEKDRMDKAQELLLLNRVTFLLSEI